MKPFILAGLTAMVFLMSAALGHAQSQMTILNFNEPGVGFNDPSAPHPASKAGGNPGTTLGEQRLIAFQYAANLFASHLSSPVEIFVEARFVPLTCDATSAVLGQARAKTFHRDFVGAPRPATLYPQALANSRASVDLDPGADMEAFFNSSLGTSCAFPKPWYFGLDGKPPAGAIDFVSVVLHEIGHGLGFVSTVDLPTGYNFYGYNDAYVQHLEDHSMGLLYPQMTPAQRVAASQNSGNLHWVGPRVMAASSSSFYGVTASGHVEMYAPAPQRPGSSVSHFSTSLSPNEIMEPFIAEPIHDLRDGLTLELLEDIGWPMAPLPSVSITAGQGAVGEAPLATVNFTVSRTGSTLNPLEVRYTTSGSATNGVDYSYLPGSVVIPSGQSSAIVTATIIDDSDFESAETVTLNLLPVQGEYILSQSKSATVAIIDNDQPPVTLAPLAVQSPVLPDAEMNLAYEYPISISGGVAPYTIKLTGGALPAGLQLNSTGVSGTPLAAGNYKVTINVTDQQGASATKTLKLKVLKAVEIATQTIKPARLGRSYTLVLKAKGGKAPYNWAVVAGTLPPALSFDNATGKIMGLPVAAGSAEVTFQVTDQLGGTSQRTLTVATLR